MNHASKCCLAELIATFGLTFIGAGSIVITALGEGSGLLGVAIAHGLVLSVLVSATMNISGAHINPAVTITMLATDRIKVPLAVGYIISQLVGAAIAGFLLVTIFNSLGDKGAAAIAACKLGTPFLSEGLGVSPGMGVVIEIGLTFMLVFVIFGTAVDHRAPKVGGFGIGLVVAADIMLGGPLTGAAMNPARVFGVLVAGGTATSGLWEQHWVYWVGPIAGALLAGFIYDKFLLDKSPIGGEERIGDAAHRGTSS